jgi:hypothetical protein
MECIISSSIGTGWFYNNNNNWWLFQEYGKRVLECLDLRQRCRCVHCLHRDLSQLCFGTDDVCCVVGVSIERCVCCRLTMALGLSSCTAVGHSLIQVSRLSHTRTHIQILIQQHISTTLRHITPACCLRSAIWCRQCLGWWALRPLASCCSCSKAVGRRRSASVRYCAPSVPSCGSFSRAPNELCRMIEKQLCV